MNDSSWVASASSNETGNRVGSGLSGASTAPADGTAVGATARDVQVVVDGGAAPPLQGPLVPGSSESWFRLPLHPNQR